MIPRSGAELHYGMGVDYVSNLVHKSPEHATVRPPVRCLPLFYVTETEMTEKPATRISYEDQGHKGRFIARVEGVEGEGELTISKVSDVLVIADHTLIPDTMRGTGAASALVGDLIADARAKGYRIVPLCLFAGQMMVFRPGDRIGLIAGESGARLMVLGGETMNGPRYITWNFVASSKKKIDAAKQAWRKGDWEHGRFRLPPGDEAEFIPLPDRLK